MSWATHYIKKLKTREIYCTTLIRFDPGLDALDQLKINKTFH